MATNLEHKNNVLKNLEEDMKTIDNFAIHFMGVLSTDNNNNFTSVHKEPISFENIALNAYGLAFEFWLTREKVKNMFENKYLEILNSRMKKEKNSIPK